MIAGDIIMYILLAYLVLVLIIGIFGDDDTGTYDPYMNNEDIDYYDIEKIQLYNDEF